MSFNFVPVSYNCNPRCISFISLIPRVDIIKVISSESPKFFSMMNSTDKRTFGGQVINNLVVKVFLLINIRLTFICGDFTKIFNAVFSVVLRSAYCFSMNIFTIGAVFTFVQIGAFSFFISVIIITTFF